MPELTIQQAFDLAIQHQLAGQLAEAENLYRQILAVVPQQPETLHQYGVLAFQLGRAEEGFRLIDQALALQPGRVEMLCDRAEMLRSSGQLEAALAAFRQVLERQPEQSTAHHNLGLTLASLGQLDSAIAEYREAIRLNPNFTMAYLNLGNALHDQGKIEAAISVYHQALASQPHSAAAYNNLGTAYYTLGDYPQALAFYQQAIALNPSHSHAHSNLGNVLSDRGMPDSAIVAFQQAIALDPQNAVAYHNLGNALKDQGRLDEALAAYRQATELQPDYDYAQSAVLFTQYYHPAYDAPRIAAAQREWNHRFAEPLGRHVPPHSQSLTTAGRDPERRLRVGYFSADFRDHAIGWFLLPLWENHDRQQVELFAYAQVMKPDFYTDKLRACVSQWRSTNGLSDQQVAELVRADQIDILVDLAMHTANNRALAFARKPAPVQVNYLAYVGSSGMPAMDYRLSDRYLDPPGMDESIYAEKTFRLAGTYWCYRPSAVVDVQDAPVLTNAHITFGCLNNFCKVNPPLLELWAKILRAVPDSRLRLHAMQGSQRERVQRQLETLGISAERVAFVNQVPIDEYYQLYHSLDIALDTTPYGGGTTTCDALWMGVPVVTLAGERAVGRGGVSILSNVGLPELIAQTPEEYVAIAVALANDQARLQEWRATLRARMQASPLMDERSYARSIEAAYRQMWRTWCAQQGQATARS